MAKKLYGTDPDQVPTNADLGTIAYQDASRPNFEKLLVTGDTAIGADNSTNGNGAASRLDVRDTTDTYITVGNNTDNTSGLESGIRFRPLNNLGNPAEIRAVSNLNPSTSSAYTAGFKFFTGNYNGSSFSSLEAMHLAADGHLKIGTVSGTGKLTVSNTQTAVDNFELAAFSGSDVNQRLTISNFLCGSDEDRVGLLFENQGTINMRVWMGDDGKLYSSAANPTSDNSGNYFVQVNSSGNIVMPNGNGIDFSATSNTGNMSSELLDDYEEGDFAPVYAISGGSVTTGSNAGRYVKVGNFVFFTFRLRTTAVSGTGALTMTLPFTSSSENRSGGSRGYARDWGVDMPEFTIYTPPSSSVALFYRHAMNVSTALSVTGSQMGTGGDDNVLEGSIVYRSA